MTKIRDLADRKTAVSRDGNAPLCLWLLSIALVGGCTDARRSSCADGTATDCEEGFVCVEEQCVPCVSVTSPVTGSPSNQTLRAPLPSTSIVVFCQRSAVRYATA